MTLACTVFVDLVSQCVQALYFKYESEPQSLVEVKEASSISRYLTDEQIFTQIADHYKNQIQSKIITDALNRVLWRFQKEIFGIHNNRLTREQFIHNMNEKARRWLSPIYIKQIFEFKLY